MHLFGYTLKQFFVELYMYTNILNIVIDAIKNTGVVS